MYVVTVMFTLRPGSTDAFMPLMRSNAEASLREEAECLRFDVCHNPERAQEVFLYEVYATQDAFRAHLNTPHFVQFDQATSDMIAEKHVRTFSEVF